MTSLLVELNGKVDHLLKSHVSRGEPVEEIGILAKANIEFPIGNKIILDEFNVFLEEQGNYSGMVIFMIFLIVLYSCSVIVKSNMTSFELQK